MKQLIYFLLALLISLATTSSWVFFRKKINKNRKVIFRLGGSGIILAFLLVIIFIPELEITKQLKGLLLGSMLILIFGAWDDYKNFSWKPQLLFQFILVLILILSGYSIFYLSSPMGGMIRTDFVLFQMGGLDFSLVSIMLVLFWTLMIINAVSWTDGVDGLLGVIAVLGAGALFLVSFQPEVNQPAVAIVSLVFLGGILGFWFLNFPPAKIEAGTSGSYFVGFFLASMAIIAGTKMATAIIVLAVPLIDFIWVIGERLKVGQAITKKDINQRHLHYKLRQLGWGDRKIILSYFCFVGLMEIIYFSFEKRIHRILFLGGEMLLILFLVWIITKQVKNKTNQ